MISLGPIHTDTAPIDGWYYLYGAARDPAKTMGSRPKVPVKIWTVVTTDETGDRIDDDRQYIQVGKELRMLTQDEWLFLARRPISEEEYTTIYVTGDWE